MTAPSPEGRDLWRYRRRLIFATCAGCALALVYLLVWGRETTIHQLLAEGLLWLLGATVLGYTVGAVADDFFRRSRWTNATAGLSPGLAVDRRGPDGTYYAGRSLVDNPDDPGSGSPYRSPYG